MNYPKINKALYLSVIIFSSLFIVKLKAQTTNQNFRNQLTEVLEKLPKRNLGPGAMSGRITSIAVPYHVPFGSSNRNTIYVGAASGGVWKSTDAGYKWEPIFDKNNVQSIGSIAIDPQNPDAIWVGTGEGNPRNSHNSGKGIYRSLDGGKTWKCMGLQSTRTIHRIIVNPNNSKQIFVGAMGSVWGPNEQRGVYRSDDGGETWKKILYTNSSSGCAELVMDPVNPNKIFACMYDYERKPWTFRSGGPGSGLYITHDGGENWKKITSKEGFPEGEYGRIGIAIPRVNSKRVYAIVEAKKTGFYRSEDGGISWTRITDDANAGNRPFYYHEIYAHPTQEDKVYSIWSQVSHSLDAGEHWKILANWGEIHPDHHAFFIHPNDPNYIINGNDGGVNISYDGGKSWRFAENIPVGQFYHIDIDNYEPYNIYGGLQDNGSWVGPAYHWSRGPIRNHEWQEVLFGDGFDCSPVPMQKGMGYAQWQGGNVYRFDLKSHLNVPIKPTHPEGKHLRFNWNAGMQVDPINPNGLYFGSQYLHYSEDRGNTWKIISSDLTTNDSSKLKQAESGGLTVDATGAENYCSILSIAACRNDKNIIWVGTDDGNIQLTRDRGVTWSLVSKNIKGLPKNAWIPYLWISEDGKTCWAVANNYRQNDWGTYVFKSIDFGKTWLNMTTNNVEDANGLVLSLRGKSQDVDLEIENEMGYARCVLPHPQSKNLVFLGTDRGLWFSINGGKTWRKWTEGFPAVPVSDLKIQEYHNDLVVGTFGRGIWVIDDISILQNMAAGEALCNDKEEIKIVNSKNGRWVERMNTPGARFVTETAFAAPDKQSGVLVDLWLNTTEKSKIKLQGEVYNTENQKIRTHRFTFDSTGYYRIYWNMIADGVRFPSHHTPKEDSDLPYGLRVKPGKYKLVVRNQGDTIKFKDSVWVEVLPPTQFDLNTQYQRVLDKSQEFAEVVKKATSSFEALKQMQYNLNKASNMEFQSKKFGDSIKLEIAQINKSIDSLKNRFMLPEGYRYYEESTLRLMDILGEAGGLLRSSIELNQNTANAIENARIATDKISDEIRDFIQNRYQPFMGKLNSDKVWDWRKEIEKF